MADNYIMFTRDEINMILWGLLDRKWVMIDAQDEERAQRYRALYRKLDDAYHRNGTMIVELPSDEC